MVKNVDEPEPGREAGPDRVVVEKLCEACQEQPALEGKPYCAACTDMLNQELQDNAEHPAPDQG